MILVQYSNMLKMAARWTGRALHPLDHVRRCWPQGLGFSPHGQMKLFTFQGFLAFFLTGMMA